MSALKNQTNIVGFTNKSVSSYYQNFLNSLNSVKTVQSYQDSIEKFFMFSLGKKDISLIGWEDIEKLEYDNIKLYINHLKKENGNKNSTIKLKLEGVKSLFKYLSTSKEHRDKIDTAIFENHKLHVATNQRGSFTNEEYLNLIEFTKNSGKSRNPLMNKGLEKSLFFETCYTTALRKSAVLNLSWSSSFQRLPDIESGEMVWTIKQVDKGGKEDVIAISNNFYNKLLQIKKEGQDRVFKLTDSILLKTINDFCKHYGIDKQQRNLTIHSLKSTAGESARIMCNNNMGKLQEFMHHSDPATTLKHYKFKTKSLKSQISYIIDSSIDTNKLDEYSKEDILNAIKKSGNSIALTILKNLEK